MVNDEDSTKRASDLLLQGATMLNLSCPECKDPIYRLRDGTLVCPTCNKRVIYERDASSQSGNAIFGPSNEKILTKISQLTEELNNETDPDKIIKLAETIKKLKEIL